MAAFVSGYQASQSTGAVIAADQAREEGHDESVLLDQNEKLTSVIAGNIFLVRRGELLTPKLKNCGILEYGAN
ncbi:MAG: aminotransferase class IV [Halioglobus sp.]